LFSDADLVQPDDANINFWFVPTHASHRVDTDIPAVYCIVRACASILKKALMVAYLRAAFHFCQELYVHFPLCGFCSVDASDNVEAPNRLFKHFSEL